MVETDGGRGHKPHPAAGEQPLVAARAGAHNERVGVSHVGGGDVGTALVNNTSGELGHRFAYVGNLVVYNYLYVHGGKSTQKKPTGKTIAAQWLRHGNSGGAAYCKDIVRKFNISARRVPGAARRKRACGIAKTHTHRRQTAPATTPNDPFGLAIKAVMHRGEARGSGR